VFQSVGRRGASDKVGGKKQGVLWQMSTKP